MLVYWRVSNTKHIQTPYLILEGTIWGSSCFDMTSLTSLTPIRLCNSSDESQLIFQRFLKIRNAFLDLHGSFSWEDGAFIKFNRHDYQTNFYHCCERIPSKFINRQINFHQTSSTYYSDIIHVNHISSGNSHQCLSIFIHPVDVSAVSMLETQADASKADDFRVMEVLEAWAPIQAWCWPSEA